MYIHLIFPAIGCMYMKEQIVPEYRNYMYIHVALYTDLRAPLHFMYLIMQMEHVDLSVITSRVGQLECS